MSLIKPDYLVKHVRIWKQRLFQLKIRWHQNWTISTQQVHSIPNLSSLPTQLIPWTKPILMIWHQPLKQLTYKMEDDFSLRSPLTCWRKLATKAKKVIQIIFYDAKRGMAVKSATGMTLKVLTSLGRITNFTELPGYKNGKIFRRLETSFFQNFDTIEFAVPENP